MSIQGDEPVGRSPTMCGSFKNLVDKIGGPLNLLLVTIPVAAGCSLGHASAVSRFIFSALSVIPLAGLMGDATEEIAEFSGPGIGGLLNATFGNAAELILGLFSVFNNLDTLVKASITGSIIGNVLLVMGMSMFAGGMKHRIQKFNKTAIGTSATVCVMASIAITIPAVTTSSSNGTEENHLSVGVAIILILSYCVMLIFSLITHKEFFAGEEANDGEKKEPEPVSLDRPAHDVESASPPPQTVHHQSTVLNVVSRPTIPKHGHEQPPKSALYKAIGMLLVASCFVAWMSEILCGAVEEAGELMGVSKVFMGVIIVAIVGNAAEHSTAVIQATKNNMDVSINIALGSALQIAMFVGPVLVLCSYARETPMNLVFTVLEVFAVFLALVIVWMVVQDGESTWMEGFLLMMLYLILALAFLFLATDDGA